MKLTEEIGQFFLRTEATYALPPCTSLECAELIYVKITGTTYSSDELCLFKEERQIVGLGNSRIKHVLDHLATLSILTVRVEALEYS